MDSGSVHDSIAARSACGTPISTIHPHRLAIADAYHQGSVSPPDRAAMNAIRDRLLVMVRPQGFEP